MMPTWLDALCDRLPWLGHADDFMAWERENGWVDAEEA